MVDRQEPDARRVEALGPAERIVQTLTTFTDHLVHNRPGVLTPAPETNIGVRWEQASWKEEGGDKKVFLHRKVGRKNMKTQLGVLGQDNLVRRGQDVVGEYRKPGIFPEVATYLYRQVSEVWRLDNEFAARWASWAFPRDQRDIKVVLAAFMLVQSRSGEPVVEDGEVQFHDDDFRAVGEAMCLIRAARDLNPKLLLRLGDVLNVPGVAEINRELGFGKSARNPARGRYYKAVQKWLRYREENPKMLEGLVKAGFRTTVQRLARRVGYKPASPKFFETLRWKQAQASDGRREMAIGAEVKKAETWAGLDEKGICQRIIDEAPNYKRIVGLLPQQIGLTRAIMAAAMEAGSVSDADLIILSPTLEDLGLLAIPEIRQRWKEATEQAENQRAANIARNVKSKEVRDDLEEAVDRATQKAMEDVTRDMRIYVIVDKSGSMEGAIEKAREYLTRFLGAFPLQRLHVSVFNTVGTEITIKAPSAAGVKHAFKGHRAGGGTSYYEGVRVLAHHKPVAGKEDALIIFVGDQEDGCITQLVESVQASGINPVAFGMLQVTGTWGGRGTVVEEAAALLGIPCLPVDEAIFDDAYAVTDTLRNLIAATPVSAAARKELEPLVQRILHTALLKKPVWAR